jgi:hypothetical protein
VAGRCDCGKTCNCAVGQSGSIAWAGSGAAQQPYRGEVRRRADPKNIIEVHSASEDNPGVAAYMRVMTPSGEVVALDDNGYAKMPPPVLKTAGGEVIQPGEDGSTTLPAAATPTYGAGLEVAGGALVPKVATAVGNDLLGGALAGNLEDDPSFMSQLVRHSSGLWAPPDHTSQRAGSGEVLVPDTLVNVTGTYTSAASQVWTLRNPSKSRRMHVNRAMVGTVHLSSPVDGKCRVELQQRVNGGTWGAVRSLHWPVPSAGTQAIAFEGELTKSLTSIVAADATFSLQLRVVCTKVGTGASHPVLIGASVAVELFGVTI